MCRFRQNGVTKMNNQYEKLTICLKQVRAKTRFIPDNALILGSGLDAFASMIEPECIINYSELTGFPVSTNAMHKGRFIFGYIGNKKIAAMQGRIHYYEGYNMDEVVMPIRLMKMMGAKTLILSNAAGGINETFRPGDLMLITDHITSFIPSPLIGQNIDEMGTRFPDMTNVYDKELQKTIKMCAQHLNISLKEGVYLQTTGPNYETPAEINAYRYLGADAVGMSTACEAMTAIHCGFKVCGISCITNMAAGMTGEPLNDEEVGIIAGKASESFCRLIKEIILSL